MAKTRNPRRKTPPWRFVKGAPAGYRKLRNRLTGKTRLIRMKRRRTGVSPVSRKKKNPARSSFVWEKPIPFKKKKAVRLRRTARGRYQVKSGKRLTARGTSRLRAMRQATLIRSVKRGWRPTGKPSLGARRNMAGLKGSNMLAFRKKRKWTVIRGSMKAGRFRVVKRGLSDGALKQWARAEKHKLRQL